MTVDIFGIADSARLQNDIFPDDTLAAIFLHGKVIYRLWFGAPARPES